MRFSPLSPLCALLSLALTLHAEPANGGPPMLVLYADDDMPRRAEENACFVAAQKMAGNNRVIGGQIADERAVKP